MALIVYQILIALIITFLAFLKISLHGAKKLPPGPNAFQVFYYLPQMMHKPHRTLRKLAESYGPLFSMHVGSQLVIVASSPETAREFCRTHDRVFSGRPIPYIYQNLPGSVGSSILLAPQCDKSWKYLRSMAQKSIFGPTVMESNAGVRKEKVVDAVEYLRAKQGEAVNLEDSIFTTLVNITSSILTSRDLITSGGGDRERKEKMDLVTEAIEHLTNPGFVDYLPILKKIDFWSKKKAMHVHRQIKCMWGEIVEQRRLSSRSCSNNDDSTRDFLDLAIATNAFSDDQICNTLMEMVAAAADSTGLTVVWLIVELIRSKELLHKVREEIELITEGDVFNESLLSQCLYLQACIKETLRLHVPAPLLVGHRAIETCNNVNNNYTIPKDSIIFVNSWAICRDSKYWDDAKIFKPERFLDSNISYKGTHFEYLPFGTGLRTCPGSNVAIKNIQMLVGSLLYYFDWDLPNGEDSTSIDVKEKYVTTLKKEKPLCLVPKLRVHGGR